MNKEDVIKVVEDYCNSQEDGYNPDDIVGELIKKLYKEDPLCVSYLSKQKKVFYFGDYEYTEERGLKDFCSERMMFLNPPDNEEPVDYMYNFAISFDEKHHMELDDDYY